MRAGSSAIADCHGKVVATKRMRRCSNGRGDHRGDCGFLRSRQRSLLFREQAVNLFLAKTAVPHSRLFNRLEQVLHMAEGAPPGQVKLNEWPPRQQPDTSPG